MSTTVKVATHSSRVTACGPWQPGDTFSGESARVDCVPCLTALADLLLSEVGDLLALNHDLRNRKD